LVVGKGVVSILDYTKSFIETQFPVSRVSKESYKERMANLGQTLTGLGKWWGRKPLVLVRAAILGVLMPVSDNPAKDREIFLKILTMDDEGLYLRKDKNITMKDLYFKLSPKEREKYFEMPMGGSPKYLSTVTKEDKEHLQKLVFGRMSCDDKLRFCCRPEHINNLPESTWNEINEHLNTSATSFETLIKELGEKRYGHTPRIGDCFAGGGSIPFEAARLGCDVYASDLNPIAALLTWASLNIAGASDEEVEKLRKFQQAVYDNVDNQIKEWGIEHNEKGHRADSYLYCSETICPDCGYKVPLAPSWIIGRGTKTVAMLIDNGKDGFDIDIIQGSSKEEIKEADKKATVRRNNIYCPHCKKETSIVAIRGDRKDLDGNTIPGLRKWEKDEFVPREDDVFQERLYCIRYVEEYVDEEGRLKTRRYYTTPTIKDLEREQKVIDLLLERFEEWQDKGYIPSAMIENGDKTDEPIRTRGWQYWHQLFNPRQLLSQGLLMKLTDKHAGGKKEKVIGLLGINKCCDWNSKLCIWNTGVGTEKAQNTFSNQALNTLFNYGCRTFKHLGNSWFFNINNYHIRNNSATDATDARNLKVGSDIWLTDPPYADAVNYHELTEFFLAWDKHLLEEAFPDWYTDSKRVLAISGVGQSFNESMVEIYKNLNNHMPDNGTQVVMFTHQDVKVWSELAMILWASGLKVVSAWNISTETDASGLKSGNYVSGTVLLTLKKQTLNNLAFPDELYDEIKDEVENMIDSMKDLDDKSEPDFNDADFLLASYAASLKVLTSYKEIDGIDIQYWLSQPRDSEEKNPIEELINKAVKIAHDYLIPEGFEKQHWRDLTTEERFFIRGLEVETNGDYRISSYQELARGFGVMNYDSLFAERRANATRLMTPSEFGMKGLNTGGFGSTLLRHLLVAINETAKSGSTKEGRAYLKSIYRDGNTYWYKKPIIDELLGFISGLEHVGTMEHWKSHAYSAKLLKEALKNEGI
jgi:putative DNA methylase